MKRSFDEHDGNVTATARTLVERLEARAAEFYDSNERPDSTPKLLREAATAIAQSQARCAELEGRINTPEIEDFSRAVCLEAAHQIERWGTAHDRAKSAEHWYWLVGYLAGKALRAAITVDREKALHHCISSAAALAHWHDAIRLDQSGAGVGLDQDLAPSEVKR